MKRTTAAILFVWLYAILVGVGAAFGQTPAYNYQYDAAGQATATFPGKTINWEYVTTPLSGATAAGTNQATAFDPSASGLGLVVFTTVGAGTGTLIDSDLPIGGTQSFVNDGANQLAIYPPRGSGGTINGNSSVTVPVGGIYTVTRTDTAVYFGAVTAGSGSGGGSVPSAGLVCSSGTAFLDCTIGSGLSFSGATLDAVAKVPGGSAIVCSNGSALVDCTIGAGLGVSGTTVSVLYGLTAGHALQGNLYNTASGVAPLDSNGLVPMGNLATSVAYAGIAFNWAGIPVSGYTVRSVTMPWGCAVPVNYAGSGGYINTASTTSATIAVASISGGSTTSRGTWTNTTGNSLVPPSQSGYSLSAGDVLTATVSTGDATAADFSLTIRCAKATP